MKGTFKESEIEVINLSEGHDTNDIEAFKYCGVVVISKDDYDRCRAMGTEIKLLRKCLDEAAEDRDNYKRQLDELNIMFDKYIKREKIIQGKGCWECSYCDPIFHFCKCRESDNYNELVGNECRCERYREYKPNADTEIL